MSTFLLCLEKTKLNGTKKIVHIAHSFKIVWGCIYIIFTLSTFHIVQRALTDNRIMLDNAPPVISILLKAKSYKILIISHVVKSNNFFFITHVVLLYPLKMLIKVTGNCGQTCWAGIVEHNRENMVRWRLHKCRIEGNVEPKIAIVDSNVKSNM